MAVSYKEYTSAKQSFINKHGKKGWDVDTSAMDRYGVYHKTYIFDDGGRWYERMAPVWRKAQADVVVEGVTVTIEKDVKLFEVEFWNSDDADSKKYYEMF